LIRVDIAADLNDEDESGFVWTFLYESRDRALIVPGAIVVAGDPDAPAVAEVVDVIDKPAGTIVYLRLLLKFTIRRLRPSGSMGESDLFGSQQYAPLFDVEIP